MLRSAAKHYATQRRRQAATVAAVRREWSKMGDDLDASWAKIAPRVATIVAASQLGAAQEGLTYVPAALAERGHTIQPTFGVDPAAFVGQATSPDLMVYGSLDTVLYGSVVHARAAEATSLQERLAVGGAHLDLMVLTQVADASRMATGVALNARPRTGWVRMVNPPCCKRCAVQAGRWFRSNQGFERHPRCDCRHIPALEADADAVGVVIGPEDVKDLTIAERVTIDAGADMNQVINASRKGQKSADGLYTREGTTRGGWHSYVQRELAKQRGTTVAETATNVGRRGRIENYVERRTRKPRPTPEAIYRYADGPEDMRRLLAANGYIVGDLRTVARMATG